MFPVLIPLRQRLALRFHALYDGMVRWMKPRSCIGYLGYPFQNKQRKSCLENLACDVDKEEKSGVVVIISAFVWNRYPK